MIDLNERLAVLETHQKVQEMHNSKIEKKVDEMHDVIMQLRGAKWLGWVVAAGVGFAISNGASLIASMKDILR